MIETKMELPDVITSEEELEDILSIPSPQLIEMMKRLEGNIMILGIAGKMGITLGKAAVRAIQEAGVQKDVIGVSRFSEKGSRDQLEQAGIKTLPCDLLDRDSVAGLPQERNIIYMAGRKFGTFGQEHLTWAMNVLVPGNVCHHFTESQIVAFSTGNVYPHVPVSSGGCTEEVTPNPTGEYAQSCLGRERIFSYYSSTNKTPVCLFRLNYAVDLRYGVLYDIGVNILEGKPVDVGAGCFNIIWQGDANNWALLALERAQSPAEILNVTGPETIGIHYAAEEMARYMGKEVSFSGEQGSTSLLNNAAKTFSHFGYPGVSLLQLISWQAHWITQGGRGLNKPTHFEISDGKY